MFNRLFSRAGLSLERLRTFCEVAEAGGMARAAAGDPVKQSQFSRQIRDLEEHFGRKLTQRVGRNVVLNKAGLELASLARHILRGLDEFHAGGSGEPAELVVGAGESFHQGVIIARIAKIRERMPHTVLVLRNLRGGDIKDGLIDGRLDIGILGEDDLAPGLESAPLGRLSYQLVIRRRDSAQHGTDWKTALRLPFVGMEGDSRIIASAERLAERAGIKLNYSIRCSSWVSVAATITQNGGVGVVPSLLEPSEECVAIPIPGLKSFSRTLCLAWDLRRGQLRTESARWQRVLAEELRV